jgi:hypothetical protein
MNPASTVKGRTLGPEFLADGREVVEVLPHVTNGFVAEAIGPDEDLRLQLSDARTAFIDAGHELDYNVALAEGRISPDQTFFEYAENIRPRRRGDWGDLHHDLVILTDDDFAVLLEEVDDEYAQAIKDLEQRRDDLSVDKERLPELIRDVALSYYRAGGDFFNLVAGGYAIARVLYGPDIGEDLLTQTLAAISDSFTEYRDEDRIDLRKIRRGLRKSPEAEVVVKEAVALTGALSRGERIGWNEVGPFVDTYEKEKGKFSEDLPEGVGKAIKSLEKKYKPKDDEKKSLLDRFRDLLKRLSSPLGNKDEEEVKEPTEQDVDFMEKLVRASAGLGIARKVLVIDLAGGTLIPWLAGSVGVAAVKGSIDAGRHLGRESVKNFWNVGVLGWSALRKRREDIKIDNRYQQVWEKQLGAAQQLRSTIAELTAQVAQDGVMRYIEEEYDVDAVAHGVSKEKVEIWVEEDQTGQVDFVVTFRKDRTGNVSKFYLEVPRTTSKNLLIHREDETWFQGKSKYEQGIKAIWMEISDRASAEQYLGRVWTHTDEWENRKNELLCSLGMTAARPSFDLYTRGLQSLLPDSSDFKRMDMTEVARMHLLLDNIENIHRGWRFLCQSYLSVDASIDKYLLDPGSSGIGGSGAGEMICFDEAVRDSSISGLMRKINNILLEESSSRIIRRLPLRQRIDILVMLARIGQSLEDRVYYQADILKSRARFDTLFSEGGSFYKRRPRFIRRTLGSFRNKWRAAMSEYYPQTKKILQVL